VRPSIGLLGANGAGKTTIADYLVAEHGYRKLSFASTLRELARTFPSWRSIEESHGYNEAKRDFPWFRQYLIDLGEGIRKYDPVYFVKALAQQITDMDPDKPWVVDDVRKQVEVNFLGDMGFRFINLIFVPKLATTFVPSPEALTLPTKAHEVKNYETALWLAKREVESLLAHSAWALGSPTEEKEEAEDEPTRGTPVLEQPDPDQSGEGRTAGGDGTDLPHWCSRCEQEWVRWGNFLPAAVGETRARWYADESRRDRDERERHGSIATVRDGEEDAVRGGPAGPGGVVPGPGDGTRYVDLDR